MFLRSSLAYKENANTSPRPHAQLALSRIDGGRSRKLEFRFRVLNRLRRWTRYHLAGILTYFAAVRFGAVAVFVRIGLVGSPICFLTMGAAFGAFPRVKHAPGAARAKSVKVGDVNFDQGPKCVT